MGGRSKKAQAGFRHFAGFHHVLCHGPVDKLLAILVDDRVAWRGESFGGRININKPGLFGGSDREGGIVGAVDVLMGGPDQGVNDYLDSLQEVAIPAYRGVLSVVGRRIEHGLNPYLRPWRYRVQRVFTREDGAAQWYAEKAPIYYDQARKASLFFALDDSNSMGAEIATLRDGVKLALDEIALGIADGVEYDLAVLKWGPSAISTLSFTNATAANVTALKAFVDGFTATSGATDFNVPLAEAGAWFAGTSDTDFDRRTLFVITDGQPFGDGAAGAEYTGGAENAFPVGVGTLPANDFLVSEYAVPTALIDAGATFLRARMTITHLNAFGAPAPLTIRISTVFLDAAGGTLAASGTGDDQRSGTGSATVDYTLAIPPGTRRIAISGTGAFFGVGGTANIAEQLVELTGPGGTFAPDPLLLAALVESGVEIAAINIGNPVVTAMQTIDSDDVVPVVPIGSPSTLAAFIKDRLGIEPDLNPAHIIRECLTNATWGLAQPESDIDAASFEAAADTFFAEGLGLSLPWRDDGPIEDFINLVGEHADAKTFVDRRTGKWRIKPIRNDYNPATLPHLTDADVVRWDRVERRDPAEGANSVTVRYYDRRRASEAARTLQDLALVTEVGRVRSAEPREWWGFPHESIVARVLLRELYAETAPIASATITCTRAQADDLDPGDPFKLSSGRPGLDFDSEIMRVDKLRDLGDVIELEIVSDVFALTDDVLTAAGPSESTSGAGRNPTPLLRAIAEESTYWQAVQTSGHTIVDVLLGEDPGRGSLVIAGSSTNPGENGAQVWGDAGTGFERRGSLQFVPSALTVGFVSSDPTEVVIPITGGVDLDDVAIGSLARLGPELCRVDAVSASSVTLGRGCLDTVPMAHPAGTVILFDSILSSLETEFTDAESIDVRFLPVAFAGPLNIALAPTVEATFDSRAIRPLPAGNVRLGGTFEPEITAALDTLPAITWAHRDRKAQTSGTLDAFTAASIGPEAGVSYVLEVAYIDPVDPEIEIVATSSPIASGTSRTLLPGDFPLPAGGAVFASVRVRASRDGYLDRGAFDFRLLIPGYGITADLNTVTADSTLFTADLDK